MTFHASTIEKLRKALEGHRDQLASTSGTISRKQQEIARIREDLAEAEQRAEVLSANIDDCLRWLDFAALFDTDADLALAFASAVRNRDAEKAAAAAPDLNVDDLVNVSDENHKWWGHRGKVVGFVYDPLGVVIEYDNLGNTHTVRPDQLMRHAEFVKQENGVFATTEAVINESAGGVM